MTFILDATKKWECPSCGLLHVTNEARPHTPMHQCKGLHGLLAPFVEATSQKTRHVVVEREDYIGDEQGVSPVMAVRTERADGSNDVHVFAPTANGKHQ